MARGGKHKTKFNVHLKNKGLDGSDEDYMVGEDEALDESEDEYSLVDDETGGFEEENEFDECFEKKIKKVGRPRGRKSCLIRSGAVKPRNRTRVPCSKKRTDHCDKKPRKKAYVSYREENEDSDFDDSDDDEEFKPDEVDFMDEDDGSPRLKRNKADKLKLQEAHTARGRKRKRNFKAAKKTRRKKTVKKTTLKRKRKESRGKGPVSKRSTENGRGRRKLDVSSNTDFVKSGFSDHEYTISEEGREQIKEASEFCGRLTTSLRSSLKTIKEEETVPSERKHAGANDKGKMVDMKIEVGKLVCGICLSEEGKRTIRGILNCCSHYFCFACILEWSKVESRCPLCKQRFKTISRTKQSDSGKDSRDVDIPVPKRDQVYQPSEEELMGYIDPYQNVVCTECHQGVDDALMLLCDLCDSSAHTYCVGLGRVVPDGNWYCDGCRPAAISSSNAQSLNPTPSHGANNNLADGSSTVRENLDLNEMYVPETPLSQETGHSNGPLEGASGSGAFTLHERRRIQQHVHHLLRNNRSRQSERSDGMRPLSGTTNLSGQVLHHQASTSTDRSPCGPSREFCGTTARNIDHNLGDQALCAGNHLSNTGGYASPQKEHVQSMVKSHLKSLSRNMDLDYNTFKCVARTCTHTILAAMGLEHRLNEVYPIETQLLVCDHFDDIGSEQIYPVGGQCLSCFDWFIRKVVREVTSAPGVLPCQGISLLSLSLPHTHTPTAGLEFTFLIDVSGLLISLAVFLAFPWFF